MKLEKYLFFLPEASRLASVRCNCKPLSQSELTILFILKLYSPIREGAMLRKLSSFYHPFTRPTVSLALRVLLSYELAERQPTIGYSISPLGREYLSYVRRYMLNRRL